MSSAFIMILKETSCSYKNPVLPIYKIKIFAAIKDKPLTLIELHKLVHLTVSGCISVLSNWYFCILSQHYRKESAQKDKGPDLANRELLNNLKSSSNRIKTSNAAVIKLITQRYAPF